MDEGGPQSTQQAPHQGSDPARGQEGSAAGSTYGWAGEAVGSLKTADLGAITVTTGLELMPSTAFTSPWGMPEPCALVAKMTLTLSDFHPRANFYCL